jgi:protein-S-isoprenylcysteine O-methyltransferase Ste14
MTAGTAHTTTTTTAEVDTLLHDYHDARRREDQWRIPQLLLALVTPLVALISVLFIMMNNGTYALIAGAIAIVTGTAAALIAVEVWRWHRTAIGIANRVRTDHAANANLLLNDPL